LSNPSLVTAENTYKYLLPSLDLNLGITDELKARFDASRTLTRPPLADINAVLTVPNTQRVNGLTATGGNPNLLPFLSDNMDLGLEWYYGRNDYVSIDGFLKEVTNFIVQGTTKQTINNVIDPTTGQPAQFSVSTEVNGPTAEVRGVELAWQHMLWDTGFGFQANATFVGTNRKYDPNNLVVGEFAFPGLANSENFVAFYEKYGFHARVAVNHRNEYLDHFGQPQTTGLYGSEPVFVDATTEVDFSAGYDFDNHFSVFFEGLNLNNATYSTHGRFADQVLDVIDYGPRFTVGAHFKF
jgi:iron complex outermembrane receptor protein